MTKEINVNILHLIGSLTDDERQGVEAYAAVLAGRSAERLADWVAHHEQLIAQGNGVRINRVLLAIVRDEQARRMAATTTYMAQMREMLRR